MNEVHVKSPDNVILMIGDNGVNADTSRRSISQKMVCMTPKRKSSAGVGQAVKRVESTSSRMKSKQQQEQQLASGAIPTAMITERVTIDRTTEQVVQQITPVITAQINKKLDNNFWILQGTTQRHQSGTSSLEQEQVYTAPPAP
ncbi:hypothetical protein ACJMK2_018254 [Sinanodonta woodiana]|uniref:Uncharacterized protein n=1 Tax=Sinanodonta woodiana TaxID=1069815 RepID=A0ABD3UCV0_SINWO